MFLNGLKKGSLPKLEELVFDASDRDVDGMICEAQKAIRESAHRDPLKKVKVYKVADY